ncbi:MAG: hypothetical protein ABII64_10505 [Elusimicrobiota bacterium]
MKQIFFILTALFLLVWVSAFASAEQFFSSAKKKRLSILGENRDNYFSTLFSTSAPQPGKLQTIPVQPPKSPEIAGEEFLQFLDDKKVLKYSGERWRKTREKTEESVYGEGVGISTRPAPPALPPGLAVDLPYESQLSISGRKMIGISYKQTLYDVEETNKRKNSGSFDMQQELQVRIKGRVGRKITVNVDFDDTTADKRDISVIYKGDPDEVIQEAAFGDINMTLPSTEFVGYSKQLFGIKVDAKPSKNTRVWGFFSRTKGLSEVKRFTGNTKFERKTILDTQYISMKYYDLKFNAADVIEGGSVQIYRDDRISTNYTSTANVTVEVYNSLTNSATTYTGDFDMLVPGQDYTVDYERGIVIFRTKPEANHVIAVDYKKSDGTPLNQTLLFPGKWKVIKNESNTPNITKELKTYYSLGNLKIIRDNGRGNFILKVIDLNNNDVTLLEPGSKTTPTYPSNITVDFDNGIFNFEPPDGKPFPDDLYSSNLHRYNILAEYKYRIKFITLRAGIVPQSERVTLDGRQLQRDIDYFIDYDAGIVTFFNEEKINESTIIDVSYDYAPFGSTGGSTLIGTRVEATLTKNLFVGSSFIYDFAARTQTIPDIRTTPTSLKVWEVDSKLQNIKIPVLPLTMSLSGEYATSERNPNIMGKALIDSMEGLQQEDSSSVNFESWQPAANPAFPGYNLPNIVWINEEISRRDMIPNLDPKRDEKLQVLSVTYDLSSSTETEVSLVQNLSSVGVDYTKKVFLEMWLFGDANNEYFILDYGAFNEDADNDGILDTEDKNNDGTLNQGEDVGVVFNNKDGSITPWGVKNGKIDTEDLDKNGSMRTVDASASPAPFGAWGAAGKSIFDVDGNEYQSVTWSGWKRFHIPLNLPANSLDWQNIKQLRMTIKGINRQKGNIKIASISLVNYKWEASGTSVSGSTMTISAINTDENADYGRTENLIFYNSEYQNLYDLTTEESSVKKEQAMSLKYSNTNASSATLATRILYTRSYDFSNYREFRFFVNPVNVNNDDILFIQIGNDSNFFEYQVPLDKEKLGFLDAVHSNGWYLLTIYQVDLTGDNKPDVWAFDPAGTMSHYMIPMSKTRVVGNPSFQNISQIKIGIIAPPGNSGEIWVNEIHANGSWIKKGYAWRLNTDMNLTSWATFGGKRKFMNRDFETFSAGVYNRDSLDDSAYVNFSRIPFLPLNYSISTSKTKTPSVMQNQNELISVNEEGQVISYSESIGSSLNPGDFFSWSSKNLFGASPNFSRYFPRFGASFSRSISDTQLINRLEDNQSWSASADWPLPIKFNLLPTSLSANYSVSNSFFRVYPSTKIVIPDDYESISFIDVDTFNEYKKFTAFHTDRITETQGLRAPFQFWNGFSFSPSYSLSKSREDNRDIMYNYPISASQNVAASSNLRIFPWMQPNFSYNVSLAENYDTVYNTMTVPQKWPSKTKTVDRSGSGEVAWNFQVKDFINFKYTQSLGFSSSYRMQDSDSYANIYGTYPVVDMDNDWMKRLKIRDNPLSDGTTTFQYRSLMKRDDKRLAGRYNPFEAFDFQGRISPLRTLSVNGTFTNSQEHTEITGTEKDTFTEVWPDLIFGLAQWEKFVFLERWLSNTQLNVSHQKKFSETRKFSWSRTKNYGSDLRFYLLKRMDMSMGLSTGETEDWDIVKDVRTNESYTISWNGQTGFYLGKWRLTLRYENSSSKAFDGTKKPKTDLLTQTYTSQLYTDVSFPGGVPIPFTKKTLPLTNRLIFTTNLSYSTKDSSLNVEKDRTNTYGINSSVDYEISQNFRSTFGLGYSRIENREKPDENYSTIEASGRLTIQF